MNKKDPLTSEEKRKGREYQKNKNIVKNLLKIPKKHRPVIYVFLEPGGVKSHCGLVVSMKKNEFKIQNDFSEAREAVQFEDIESIKILSTLDLIADSTMLRRVLKRQQDVMNEITKKIKEVF